MMQFNHVWRQQTLRCNFFKHLYKFSSTFQGILFFFQANYIFKHFSSTRVKIQALFQSVLHPEYALSPPLIITTQHCQWCIGVNIGYTPPLKIPHPTHYSKSVCKHFKRKQIRLLPGRSSQQTCLFRLTKKTSRRRISGLLWGDCDWIAVLPKHHSQLHLTQNFEYRWTYMN